MGAYIWAWSYYGFDTLNMTDMYIIQGELLHYVLQRKDHVRIDIRQRYNYFLLPFIN